MNFGYDVVTQSGAANLFAALCVSRSEMKGLTRTAALAALLLAAAACQPFHEQKELVVQGVAAILIAPVIDAQSADARQDDGAIEPALCDTPCEPAPVETCSLTTEQKRAPRQKA